MSSPVCSLPTMALITELHTFSGGPADTVWHRRVRPSSSGFARRSTRVTRKVFCAAHEGFPRPKIAMSSAGSCFILRMVAAILV